MTSLIFSGPTSITVGGLLGPRVWLHSSDEPCGSRSSSSTRSPFASAATASEVAKVGLADAALPLRRFPMFALVNPPSGFHACMQAVS